MPRARFKKALFILGSVSAATLLTMPLVTGCNFFPVPQPETPHDQEPGGNSENQKPPASGGDSQNPGDGDTGTPKPPITDQDKPQKPTAKPFPTGITTANFPAYYDDPVTDPYTPRPPLMGGAYITPEDQEYRYEGNSIVAVPENHFIHGTTLGNSHYNYIANRSVGIKIDRDEKTSESGTGWWMDYLKTNDATYPLTWYLATNLHVVTAYKNADDNYGERDITSFNNQYSKRVNIGALTAIDQPFRYEPLNIFPKTIFTATKFLNGNAQQIYGSKYLTENHVEAFAEYDLMLDFAIMEIQFNDVQQAKRLTYNLAANQSQPVVKFKNGMYFNEKRRYQLQQVNDLYVGGFPGNHSGYFTINTLERDRNKKPQTGTKFAYRLTNEVDNIKKRTLPGMYDAMSEYNFQWNFDGNWYKRAGISYELELNNFWPGASGSMGINSNNEIIGIYWGFAGSASSKDHNQPRAGFLDPIISPYGYIDSRGNYAPFRYDLIFGGIEGQIKSFKSQMQTYHKGQSTPLLGAL